MGLFDDILDFSCYKSIGLNYYGAKKSIAPHLFTKMHEIHFKKYANKAKIFLDCFGGGGSMSLASLQLGYKAIYNELRPDLCAFFQGIKDGKSSKFNQGIGKDEYRTISKIPRDKRTFDEVSKLLFHSFNFGLERKAYTEEQYKLAEPFFKSVNSLNLADLNIVNSSFFDFDFKEIEPKDIIIYADIPYQNSASKKSYRGIYDKRFDIKKFCEWCIDLQKNGFIVYVSEYDAPSDDFECVLELKKRSYLSGQNVYERLFVLKNCN